VRARSQQHFYRLSYLVASARLALQVGWDEWTGCVRFIPDNS
jgi:hypothetical protein